MTQFRVNRAALTQRSMSATVNGKTMPATVDVLEVELVHDDGEQGTILKTFWTPEDQAAAKAKYTAGAVIDLDV